MTEPQPDSRRTSRLPVVLGGVLLLGLIGSLMYGVFARPRVKPVSIGKTIDEDHLSQARQSLTRGDDLATCRLSLQQASQYLEKNPQAISPLSASDLQALQKQLDLTPVGIDEITKPMFSQLDGWYLYQSMLFRDIANNLQITNLPAGPGGKPVRQATLDRVETGFRWMMRQIRPLEHDGAIVPPLFALRRGQGNSLERALAFLELVRQIGPLDMVQGCLVVLPERGNSMDRLWACGVIVEKGKEIYLFDPRMGMAIPGPMGKGIATLSQAAKDPSILGQLTQLKVSPGTSYDVTSEQAGTASLRHVCSLSALSPRIRFLEESLRGNTFGIQLASNPTAEIARLQLASGSARVIPWREEYGQGKSLDGAGLFQRFFPVAEGGIDTVPQGQMATFQFNLVPWRLLPKKLLDSKLFPPGSPPQLRLVNYFAGSFVDSIMTAGKPRDQMLHGRLSAAIRDLVKMQSDLRSRQVQQFNITELDQALNQSVQQIVSAYANQQREKNNPARAAQLGREIEEAWKAAIPLFVILEASTFPVRQSENDFLLALCKHEEAEQIQNRINLLRNSGLTNQPESLKRANDAWQAALDSWEVTIANNPSMESTVPFARLHLGRCLMQMNRSAEAKSNWEKASRELVGLPAVHAAFLASQLK